MQKKMVTSGIERLIKRQQRYHVKNSEKRVLARKNLERKLKGQAFARQLQSILLKKIRYNVFFYCSLIDTHLFLSSF
ncbi:hypothetical protein GIB67_030964 [Kingdonia uniflora]|uniref:Ribosomal protein S21 n=1 Tax=Kingdonia uniflora TaxID=39325 RepID=A0A7J7L3I0_9MAGN|nr:hypothetical protein GIB67_030964 [Kingdonia uniflora]